MGGNERRDVVRVATGIARLLVCALSCVGFACAAGAQLVRIPHTFVSLSPPLGFTATRTFGGFENRRAGWMIRVEEFDPSENRLVEAFSSPARANALFGSEGIRIARIEQLALETGTVPLAIGVPKTPFGRELVKYMALMHDRGAALVVVMFNLSRSSTLGRSEVEAVLRSVKLDRPTTLPEWRVVLPFSFRDVAPFHMTNAGPGWAWLGAFDDDADRSKWLTVRIFWRFTETRPAETALENARRGRSLWGAEATIVEQRAEAFADGSGDFIVASADGRTAFHFLRVLPNQSEIGLSAVGESRAMEAARGAVMDIATSVELRESALGPVDAR